MNESRSPICEHCGFDINGYETMPTALSPGILLHENYILGTVLGKGGFGITYVGFDLRENRKVAIKEYFPATIAVRDTLRSSNLCVSPSQQSLYESGVMKFYNEAAYLAQLNHIPAIVKVFDFFYENNTAYIVMEYIEGTTIEDIVRKQGPLELGLVLTIYYPILNVLSAIHKLGILHRDISPCNVILDERFNARLIDFGASRAFSAQMSSDLSVILKNGFAPVEQYTRKGHHGPAEDIYALAASMYYTLTGKIPPVATERLVFDTIRPISSFGVEISPSIESIIIKGLSVKAEDRYQSAEEMCRAIDEALSNDSADSAQPCQGNDPQYKEEYLESSVLNESAHYSNNSGMYLGIILGAVAILAVFGFILIRLLA